MIVTGWASLVELMYETRNAYKILVGRPEGRRLLWRLRRLWNNHIDISRIMTCDVNLLGDSINTIKENSETLLEAVGT
jgi:hypothetical protein